MGDADGRVLERAAETLLALAQRLLGPPAFEQDGRLVRTDVEQEAVARWNFTNGWPSKWTGADFDASSNEIATEKIVITHEGLERTNP